jgi:hypothetical protein
MLQPEKIMFCLFAIAFVFATIEYFFVSYQLYKLEKSILEKKLAILESLYLEQLYKKYE